MNSPPMSIDAAHRLFSYDASTGLFNRRVAMSKYPAGSPCGTHRHDYMYVRYQGKMILAHRLAWAMHHGEWPTVPLDHINMDRMDNRIENLRLSSVTENNRNRGADKRNALGIKGVAFDRRSGRYVAKISADRVTHHLGHFQTRDEAAHAYNKAALRLHGEFARLNPIGNKSLAADAQQPKEPT